MKTYYSTSHPRKLLLTLYLLPASHFSAPSQDKAASKGSPLLPSLNPHLFSLKHTNHSFTTTSPNKPLAKVTDVPRTTKHTGQFPVLYLNLPQNGTQRNSPIVSTLTSRRPSWILQPYWLVTLSLLYQSPLPSPPTLNTGAPRGTLFPSLSTLTC